MNFTEIINKRFSVRSYTSKKIENEIILEILDAARMAPSAVNFQPWHFIVITDPEKLTQFHEVYHRSWFKEAPVCVVVCADHQQSWKRKSDEKDFADVDAAISIDHLILKATELGIGTCWICNFDTERARTLLCLPEHVEPIAIVPLGYTKAERPEKKRKAISEIVYWNQFTAP
jgi:nitroreductase